MGTRITLKQYRMSPDNATDPGGSYSLAPSSVDIPHVENAWCQGMGLESLGGQAWLVNVLIFEPERDN